MSVLSCQGADGVGRRPVYTTVTAGWLLSSPLSNFQFWWSSAIFAGSWRASTIRPARLSLQRRLTPTLPTTRRRVGHLLVTGGVGAARRRVALAGRRRRSTMSQVALKMPINSSIKATLVVRSILDLFNKLISNSDLF